MTVRKATGIPVLLSQLISRPSNRSEFLLQCLSQNGYAIISIDRPDVLNGIQDGLKEASALSGFRFPDVAKGNIQYNEASRRCFKSLFDVATTVFCSIIKSTHTAKERPLPKSIQRSIAHVEDLRSKGCDPSTYLFQSDPNSPFGNDDNSDLFSSTFFNLFNYNNGMLNAHKDRGLVTVIASRLPSNNTLVQPKRRRSALWMEHPHISGRWVDLDSQLCDNQVLVFMGEAGQSLFGGLPACRHTVRVDPTGEYVAHSHFRHDPESHPELNRVSVAMILNQEENESN